MDIQLEAINRYIDNLELCEEQDINRKYAYIWTINHYRKKTGLKPIKKKEELKIYQKWIKEKIR